MCSGAMLPHKTTRIWSYGPPQLHIQTVLQKGASLRNTDIQAARSRLQSAKQPCIWVPPNYHVWVVISVTLFECWYTQLYGCKTRAWHKHHTITCSQLSTQPHTHSNLNTHTHACVRAHTHTHTQIHTHENTDIQYDINIFWVKHEITKLSMVLNL